MNVLITGAAGFLGFHLAKHHLYQGDKVTGLDDYSSGNPKNIDCLSKHDEFGFIEADVRSIDEHSLGGPFERIYNLACVASPPLYQLDPIKTLTTSVLGIHSVLQLAVKQMGTHGVSPVVVQASTSEIYGNPTVHPQHEDYWGNVNTYGPRACYDEGKRAAETLCYDFRHQHGVDARVVRLFNTYGPGMQINDGRAIPNFITQVLQQKPVTIVAERTRSFCYVNDTISGIVAAAEAQDLAAPVNIGNDTEVSLEQVVDAILRCLKADAEIEYIPTPVDDPTRRRPDLTRAKSLLGYHPSTKLDEGIALTIRDIRERLQQDSDGR